MAVAMAAAAAAVAGKVLQERLTKNEGIAVS